MDAFGLSRREADGLQTRCRDCRRAYREANREAISAKKRAAYRANAEAVKARSRAHYAAHREAGLARRREYYAKNRERMIALGKHYYETHREECAALSRRWRAENRDRRRDAEQSRRARVGGYFVEHVDRLVLLERHQGRCGICGETVDSERFDVDHVVPIARGGEHSYANTQPAHGRCNQSKKNRLMHEHRARQAAMSST